MTWTKGAVDEERAVALIREAAEPLPPAGSEAFGALFDRFAGARVVLLGEATHGTHEFYRARAAITRRLVERHDFSIVAVEADWPDTRAIDAYVRGRTEDPLPPGVFDRFPTWMWRNEEVRALAGELRDLNEGRAEGERVEFRGLDVYSMTASMRAVLAYLDEHDPETAGRARERYGCLSPWHAAPERYGREVVLGARHACEEAVTGILRDLLDRGVDLARTGDEAFFDAEQNARIVRAAEQYYRAMYRGSVESWNLRDRHMFDTLQRLLTHRGEGAKAVVWAHNSHIGNASATEMGWGGEYNIGELCRTAYREEAVLIGFSTDRGTVAAATDWDGPMEVKRVRPAREDSVEALFRRGAGATSLTELRGPRRSALREALRTPRLERAVGVVYRPETERQSHYFKAVLPDQFDALVWFEETRTVTPLPAAPAVREDVPETFPSGL